MRHDAAVLLAFIMHLRRNEIYVAQFIGWDLVDVEPERLEQEAYAYLRQREQKGMTNDFRTTETVTEHNG